MSRWGATTTAAELQIIAEYGSASVEEYVRAKSRADDGRDPTEPTVATDGGVVAGDGPDAADDELPPLAIGDHVTDRDDADEPPLVVTGLPLTRAATYDVDGTSLAEYNPEYPRKDHAIEVAYAQQTDVSLKEQQTYAFPRSRLRLVTPLHDRDNGGDQEDSDA